MPKLNTFELRDELGLPFSQIAVEAEASAKRRGEDYFMADIQVVSLVLSPADLYSRKRTYLVTYTGHVVGYGDYRPTGTTIRSEQ